MFQLIAIVLALSGIVLAFVAPAWAWTPVAFGVAGIWLLFAAVRRRRYGPVPELSSTANEMLAKFGHYYVMPFAGRDVSAAASSLTLATMAVGVICIFKGHWWSVGASLVLYMAAAPLSRQFDPTNFLVDERERAAHEEVVAYVTQDRGDTAR